MLRDSEWHYNFHVYKLVTKHKQKTIQKLNKKSNSIIQFAIKDDTDIIDYYPSVDIVRYYYKDYKQRERIQQKYSDQRVKT